MVILTKSTEICRFPTNFPKEGRGIHIDITYPDNTHNYWDFADLTPEDPFTFTVNAGDLSKEPTGEYTYLINGKDRGMMRIGEPLPTFINNTDINYTIYGE